MAIRAPDGANKCNQLKCKSLNRVQIYWKLREEYTLFMEAWFVQPQLRLLYITKKSRQRKLFMNICNLPYTFTFYKYQYAFNQTVLWQKVLLNIQQGKFLNRNSKELSALSGLHQGPWHLSTLKLQIQANIISTVERVCIFSCQSSSTPTCGTT